MLNLFKKLFSGNPQKDYRELIEKGAIIIDVRTKGEFQGGHIKGSINIPLDSINNEIPELKKKNKPVITCCRSGNRSGMAKAILERNGIECYNGGAWNVLDKNI